MYLKRCSSNSSIYRQRTPMGLKLTSLIVFNLNPSPFSKGGAINALMESRKLECNIFVCEK